MSHGAIVVVIIVVDITKQPPKPLGSNLICSCNSAQTPSQTLQMGAALTLTSTLVCIDARYGAPVREFVQNDVSKFTAIRIGKERRLSHATPVPSHNTTYTYQTMYTLPPPLPSPCTQCNCPETRADHVRRICALFTLSASSGADPGFWSEGAQQTFDPKGRP